MNLAELVEHRKQTLGVSLHEMSRRARDKGTPISVASLSAYARGDRTSFPNDDTRVAIANALDVDLELVTTAAIKSAAPHAPDDDRSRRHSETWLRITEGRSDAEIRHLLAVVKATVDALDAMRQEDR